MAMSNQISNEWRLLSGLGRSTDKLFSLLQITETAYLYDRYQSAVLHTVTDCSQMFVIRAMDRQEWCSS